LGILVLVLRQSHPRNDGQSQKLSSHAGPTNTTQAHLQANPNKFEETTTPDNNCNMQQVLRVQAPPSIPKPHTNDNRQITHSMQPQSPIPRVSTNNPAGKPISAPFIATTIESTGKPVNATGSKPTTLPANLSKRKCHCKQQAA
jgi:hypothetical protein